MAGPVTDAFLLSIAEISAALVGLFLVGVFFYVETGFRRLALSHDEAQPYFRTSTLIVLILYSIPIGIPLTLVSLDLAWSKSLYALLSLLLIGANVIGGFRLRSMGRATGSHVLLVDEVAGFLGVLASVTVPWLLGGFNPSREDLTWGILLAFATGFLSIITIVLSAFDFATAGAEDAAVNEGHGAGE